MGAVVDAAWGAGGSCLLTASMDQTVRITTRAHAGGFVEIARPQVGTPAPSNSKIFSKRYESSGFVYVDLEGDVKT